MIPAFVFDIDGTLSLLNGRDPFDYSKISEDLPNNHVILIFLAIQSHNSRCMVHNEIEMIIVTGRPETCIEDTKKWLMRNWIHNNILYMRKEWDNRPDTEVKKEIYEQCIKDKYEVLGVFEDRQRLVDMYRGLGLTVFQVAPGQF